MGDITTILDNLLSQDTPYGLNAAQKALVFKPGLKALTRHHFDSCAGYHNIFAANGLDINDFAAQQIPALSVQLFKHNELLSVSKEQVIKTLTSSGTTSQQMAKILLDAPTSRYQTKVLVHILQAFLGKKCLPMLIIDHPNVIKDRQSFSARGAGIIGLSTFGRDHTYALDDNMAINFSAIKGFIEKYPDQPILLFGFTFMVWQHFIEALNQSGEKLNLSQAILLHSGGWKKLQRQALSNSDFKAALEQTTGITRVHNFYGMAEQVGSVLVECEQGYLHCSNFSDIHIKSTDDLSNAPPGQAGVVVIESLLPMSYPGHRLLTEDTATLIGEDNCRCGRLGKYILVHNRVARTQARGCSDVG